LGGSRLTIFVRDAYGNRVQVYRKGIVDRKQIFKLDASSIYNDETYEAQIDIYSIEITEEAISTGADEQYVISDRSYYDVVVFSCYTTPEIVVKD